MAFILSIAVCAPISGLMLMAMFSKCDPCRGRQKKDCLGVSYTEPLTMSFTTPIILNLPTPVQSIVSPTGCLKPINLAAASLIINPAVSDGNAGLKSLPSFTCQLTVLPKSDDTAMFVNCSCNPGSLPRQLNPPALISTPVIWLSDWATLLAAPLASRSLRNARYCLFNSCVCRFTFNNLLVL